MSLDVHLQLDDEDLKHFMLIMHQARSTAAHVAPEDVIAAAENLIEEIRTSGAPDFVLQRLTLLRELIDMLTDIDWRLPPEDADRVFNALTYFSEPEDLIPDNIPALGYLDDAIMIELVSRELGHEVEAYRDFCTFRNERRASGSGQASREDWLASRRQELQKRMRQRRRKTPANVARRLFASRQGQ